MSDIFDTVPTGSPAYVPSPTAERFIGAVANGPLEEMRLLILMASRGEGKTTAAIYSVLELADRLRREGRGAALPIRVATIRDSWVNLERTTLVSFEENRLKGLPVAFRNGRREAIVEFDMPLCHFYFFGLDRPEDADKLQGFSCGALWIEEPAPAADLATGVPAESLGIGATSLRQDGVPPRILLTLNPPDPDHWVLRVEEHLTELGLPELRVATFHFSPGEKSALFETLATEAKTAEEASAWSASAREFDAYRKRNRATLEAIGRLDLVARLVEGQTGDVQVGEAVVPGFSRRLHVAPGPLDIFRSLPILRFWDGGGTPSCVWAQDLPQHGGLNILGSRTALNAGMEEFIRDEVLPFQHHYGIRPQTPGTKGGFGYGPKAGHQFRDIGDPSMLHEGKTVRADYTTGQVIMQMLNTSFEPGPVEWSARREALHAAFGRTGKGDRPRFVQIDPDENDLLIKALAGRFRYPKDLASGRVIMTIEAAKRVSGIAAQAVDAFAYGLATLYPAEDWLRRIQQQPVPRTQTPRPTSWLGV